MEEQNRGNFFSGGIQHPKTIFMFSHHFYKFIENCPAHPHQINGMTVNKCIMTHIYVTWLQQGKSGAVV